MNVNMNDDSDDRCTNILTVENDSSLDKVCLLCDSHRHHQGFGRDAGLLRIRLAGDGMPRKPGDTLTIQVQGATGLLSDTPQIHDLTTFTDSASIKFIWSL